MLSGQTSNSTVRCFVAGEIRGRNEAETYSPMSPFTIRGKFVSFPFSCLG